MDSADMDSLFEGMDFEMPLEEPALGGGQKSQPPQDNGAAAEQELGHENSHPGAALSKSPSLSEPKALSSSGAALLASPTVRDSGADPSESRPAGDAPPRDPSGPLDESLFSGLTVSSAEGGEGGACIQMPNVADGSEIQTSGAASGAAEGARQLERLASFDESPGGNRVRDGGKSEGGGTESIMAVYDDASTRPTSGKHPSSGIPPISRTSGPSPSPSLSLKPSMRRKKRSMKIGYGREEEENEELAGRKVGIRETFGTVVAGKDGSNASSGSTPTRGLSRESSQGAIHVEVSSLGSGLGGDAAHENGGEPVKEESLEGMSLSKYSTLEVHGMERVASREFPEDIVAQTESDNTDVMSVGPGVGDRAEMGSPQDDKTLGVAAEDIVSGVKIVAGDSGTDSEGGAVIIEAEVGIVIGAEVGDRTGTVEGATVPSEDEVEIDIDSLAERKDGTIEERLTLVQDAVAFKLKALHGRMSALSALRKAAVQKRRQAADEVAAASAKRRQLEAELDAACEREDFEMADSLSGSMAEAESKMGEVGEAFTAAETGCDLAASKLQEVLDSQVAVQEKGATLLRLVKVEADNAAKKVITEAQETANGVMERLMEEEEKTAARQNVLDLQRKEIEDSNSELRRAIEALTVSDTEERAALTEQRSRLSNELLDLLALVRTKEAEIADFDERIAAVDGRVSTVAATFEDQRHGLDSELQTLAASERQLAKECSSILEGKGRVEQILADSEQVRLRLENVARCAADAAEAMQGDTEIKRAAAVAAMQSREKTTELIEREKQAHAEAHRLRQNAASTRLALQELSSTKEKLGQELAGAKDRIVFVDKRVQELDTEKKLAAAARNFKAAARLATEAKALTAEKDVATADVERIVKKVAKVDRKAEVKLSELGGLDDGIAMKEREAAMAHCGRLRLVAAAARHERDVAIELNDFEEGESLASEANAADAEAQSLQDNYQLEGKEYEIHRNSSASESTVSMTIEVALANCERLRLEASAARDERDSAIELDQFEEAETLHLKAEDADAEADRLQRLYQLEGDILERQTITNGNVHVASGDQEAGIIDDHSGADIPEDETRPADDPSDREEAETLTPKGRVAGSEVVGHHERLESSE